MGDKEATIGKTRKKSGPPPADVNWKLLDAVLQYGATLVDCTEHLKLSDVTIQKAIKREFGMTFTEYRHKKLSTVRLKLLQKQIEIALNGNVALLIWLGKQHLGQTEKIEQDLTEQIKVTVK